MRLSQKQLRSIIQEELVLVLETRAARNWIANYAEKKAREEFEKIKSTPRMTPDLNFLIKNNEEDMFAFYELGAKNESDLATIASWKENGDFLGDPQKIDSELELYYSGKFKNLLKNILGITQLGDFRNLGHFKVMMEDLAKYDQYEQQQQAEREAAAALADYEKTEDGAIKIAQIGDWELLDPHIGDVSARCAVGTTWCTRTASTYNQYTAKDTKLYYLFNNKNEYPYDKISIGVKDGQFIWGGNGGKSVDAANNGIRSLEQALSILGDGGLEILKTLQDYYHKDTTSRRQTHYANKLTDDVYIQNHLNFLRKAKELKDNSGLRINFYKNLITFLDTEAWAPTSYAEQLLLTFKYILNDKEMNKTKYALEDKKFIKDKITEYLADYAFISQLTDEQKQNNFGFIYDALIARNTNEKGKIDHFEIYQILMRNYRDSNEFKEHRSKALEELTEKRKAIEEYLSSEEQKNDTVTRLFMRRLADIKGKLEYMKHDSKI